MNIHSVKIFPEFFLDLKMGRKTSEIRFDDRDYRIGDLLEVCEWLPKKKKFTGKKYVYGICGITRLHRVIPDVDHRWVALHLVRTRFVIKDTENGRGYQVKK